VLKEARMKPMDFLKAFGVAVLLMVLNVAIAFGVMWVFGNFINPGHERTYYQDAAQRIAPWSSLIAGAVLFFLGGWVFSKRKPARDGVVFAASFALIYVAIDVAIIAAAGALGAMGAMVAASAATKLMAALAGAVLARRQPLSQ